MNQRHLTSSPPTGRQQRDTTETPWPERVEWEILGPDFVRAWGYPRDEFTPEHMEILGPTRSGKTYFQAVVLQMRAAVRNTHVVVLATKPADATILSMGWPVISKWPPPNDDKHRQVIYWAKRDDSNDDDLAERYRKQQLKVRRLLDDLFVEDANIILVWDEVAYIEHVLKLSDYVTMYQREGAGLGITNVFNTQRGARVSRYVHSESSWTICFKPKDADDTKRIAEILGDRRHYIEVLNSLDASKREFLMVHSLTGEAYISHIPEGTLKIIKGNSEKPRFRDASV